MRPQGAPWDSSGSECESGVDRVFNAVTVNDAIQGGGSRSRRLFILLLTMTMVDQ